MDELRPDHIPASGPRILGFQNTAECRRDGGVHGAGQTPAESQNIADRIVGVVRHEGILLVIALEHIAFWTTQLERLKDFYVQYFDGIAGPRYENPSKDFASYFISFAGGSRLEIMQMPSIPRSLDDVHRQFTGFIHVAFAPDSAKEIDRLTAVLQTAGCVVLERPHMTGDGYYESVILDPDGNRVELSYRTMA